MARIALANKLKNKSGMSTIVEAKKVINSLILCIQAAIVEDKVLTLVGLGSFKIVKRNKRKGRNLKTGAAVHIAACNTIKFTPSKSLRTAILK